MKRIKDTLISFIQLMVEWFIVTAFLCVIFILPLLLIGFVISLFGL